MALTLLLSFFIGAAAHAEPADCLNGFWDFGPRTAVLLFQCHEDDNNKAVIMFCNRRKVINKGFCLSPDSIPCEWKGDHWACAEDHYSSTLRRLSPTTIRYKFRSLINSGTLQGELLQ